MLYGTPNLDEDEREVLSHLKALEIVLRPHPVEPSTRWRGLLARTLRARAVQGSNSIEGYHVSDEDALAAVDGDNPGQAEDAAWEAVVGYQRAMSYVLNLAAAAEFSYDFNLIRALHLLMVQGDPKANPGLWRPGTVYVRRDATGEIVHEGPSREVVPTLVDELCAELQAGDADPTTRFVRAAMAHLNLVMIHPFSDGNGRMSRCLQTLVLARGGLLDPAFCSIEEYLGANTLAYYDVLAAVGGGAWHPERDARPWVRFCLSAHVIQAETTRRRLDYIALVGGRVEEILARAGLPDRAAVSLANAVLGYRIRNESYRREAAVSPNLASRDLKLLTDAGLLVARGEKRARVYEAGPELVALRSLKRPPPAVRDPFVRLRSA